MKWLGIPQFKIEVGGKTYINELASNIMVSRPENNVSYLTLTIDDYKSKSFIGIFDALNPIEVSLRYAPNDWTKVFSGTISTVRPRLGTEEILEVGAWEKGWALLKTHCNTSYGKESKNPTKYTPTDILTHLIDNYVNKSFGGDSTGHNLTKSIAIFATPDVTHLLSAYKSNFDIINTVLDIRQAHAGTNPGPHWIVDPDGRFRVKTVGADQTGWTGYYGGSQEASTIEVAKDMILYDFRKNIEEYANKIVLCSALRKPGYDRLTEGIAAQWGATDVTLFNSVTPKVVGVYSLRANSAIGHGEFWFPSAKDAAWDLTKIGSEKTIPSINVYVRRSGTLNAMNLGLYSTASDYYYWNIHADITEANKFFHFSLPIGPYYDRKEEKTSFKWNVAGTPLWASINYIQFTIDLPTDVYIYLDDLHFAGSIIREAYNSTAIINNKEYQRVILNDTAVDDSMKASDDSGTAARLAYAELLRRMQTPTVGIIRTPLIPDILPGQLVHIHAAKKTDGSFRINADFRIKEIKQEVNIAGGATTTLNLTDDVTNSHAFGAPTLMSLLAEYAGALGHAEAKNLKGAGIDILVPRLSKDYA